MAAAYFRADKPRPSSTVRYLTRLARVNFLNTAAVVDQEFDENFNAFEPTSEGLDHLHQHGSHDYAS